jgi:DNA modification methylase
MKVKLNPAYETASGEMYEASIEEFLASRNAKMLEGKVQLIFTSPPFPLLREKEYGNHVGNEYLEWLAALAQPLRNLLSEDGSLVIEIGNAWEKGRPVMSTLPLKALMAVLEESEMHLCQQFIAHNPARLPSPAQWVNVERIRVKDSFTNVWWLGRTERPKASNQQVLTPYSDSMKKLLDRGSYNGGKRPSEHKIGESSFLTNNGGAIPPNVLMVSNTRSKSAYTTYCRENEIKPHPARMPFELADFFIRLLTDPGDLVFDPFGGSNTTGAVAEVNERRWVSVEREARYVSGSRGHFKGKESNQRAA